MQCPLVWGLLNPTSVGLAQAHSNQEKVYFTVGRASNSIPLTLPSPYLSFHSMSFPESLIKWHCCQCLILFSFIQARTHTSSLLFSWPVLSSKGQLPCEALQLIGVHGWGWLCMRSSTRSARLVGWEWSCKRSLVGVCSEKFLKSMWCGIMTTCNLEIYRRLASYPGCVGGKRRPGIDCLRMRGRFCYISVKL